MTGIGLRGRRTARGLLLLAIALDALLALLFLAAPTSRGPMFQEPPAMPLWLVPVVGIGLNLLGLAWMIRLYRADPEAGRSSWRATRR